MSETFAAGMLHFKKGSIYDGRISINDYEMTPEELKHNLEVILGEARGRGIEVPAAAIKVWKMDLAELVDLGKAALQEMQYRGVNLEPVLKPFVPAPKLFRTDLDDVEMAMVETGRHIPAIKAYRARTGVGLKDAKDACDAYRDAWQAAGSPKGGIPKPPQF